jgi:hypothetical protein
MPAMGTALNVQMVPGFFWRFRKKAITLEAL